uniref:Si:ch211-191d15.2 n=1 Tax=Cyprinus carpio TaxID=7962 RepID=A0A8C1SXJ7_CYPCA
MRPSLLCCLLLYLSSSLLAGLVVSPCPKGCCCPSPGALVLCESLGLHTLPRSPYSGLQELSLSHNQLVRFPRGLPSSLETLQLQENQITYITAGSLRQLGNLTRLDLEDNRIRAIQPGALQGLTRLRMLTLKGNRLSRLPPNLPSSLIHLDRAFDGLSRLRSVELANNQWVCECDILYLYRWLLTDRLRMATDLVCTAPLHLAQKLLLTLSVMAICPKLFKPVERKSTSVNTESGKVVESHIEQTISAYMLVRSDTACNVSSFRCRESSKLPESTISRSFFGSDHELEAMAEPQPNVLNLASTILPFLST